MAPHPSLPLRHVDGYPPTEDHDLMCGLHGGRPGMTWIKHVSLPMIGWRYDLTTRSGHRISVVVHQSGRRDLVAFDVPDDPDAGREVASFEPDEVDVLVELLAHRRYRPLSPRAYLVDLWGSRGWPLRRRRGGGA
jgi:hypothetical protein